MTAATPLRAAALAGAVLACGDSGSTSPDLCPPVCGPGITTGPYPPSPVVARIDFDFSTHRREAPGSDNWPITWADDGHQYAVWGDGGGFGGTNQDGRVSLGVARIEGPKDAYTGHNVYGGKVAPNPAAFGGKSNGILSVGGTLYMWVGPGSNTQAFTEARLYRSTDRGASWTAADWAFTAADGIFLPTFAQFGRDYAGARDDFVYAYAMHLKDPQAFEVQRPGEIALLRAPRGRLMERGAYSFFAGMDGGSPRWTPDIAARRPVFEDPNGVGPKTSVSYNAGIGRFFLMTAHSDFFGGRPGIFDAPEPWGPWTTVRYDGVFGEGELEDTRTFFWSFSNKWASADGREVVLLFTGSGRNDSWNTVEGRIELR